MYLLTAVGSFRDERCPLFLSALFKRSWDKTVSAGQDRLNKAERRLRGYTWPREAVALDSAEVYRLFSLLVHVLVLRLSVLCERSVEIK